MAPEPGRIQSLPVHVFYNHTTLSTTNHPPGFSSPHLQTTNTAHQTICSLVIPEVQDVFVHRPIRLAAVANGSDHRRKRRRVDRVKREEDRDVDDEDVETVNLDGDQREDEDDEEEEEELEMMGSVALKGLIKAICYASPDLMPSHSVPDSSIYIPSTSTTTATSSTHHQHQHPQQQRRVYEGKGLLSLILTEPPPGKTLARGRLVRSACFSGIPAGGADDGDDEDGGGGLEALVRAAKRHREDEEEDDGMGWGLEVEMMMRPIVGMGTGVGSGGAVGTRTTIGINGPVTRHSSPLPPHPRHYAHHANHLSKRTGDRSSPAPIGGSSLSMPMNRRRSRTEDVRTDQVEDNNIGDDMELFNTGDGDEEDGRVHIVGQELQLPPAYHGSQSPPPRQASVLGPQPRLAGRASTLAQRTTGPRAASMALRGVTPASLGSESTAATRGPRDASTRQSGSTPAASPRVNNPDFEILPPIPHPPARRESSSRPTARTNHKASAVLQRSNSVAAVTSNAGARLQREGATMPMSDPLGCGLMEGEARRGLRSRAASVEPLQVQRTRAVRPGGTSNGSASGQPVSAPSAPPTALQTPRPKTASLAAPPSGNDLARTSPGSSLALARSILRNPNINTMELAQKLIGKDALVQLLGEMGVDLPGVKERAGGTAATSRGVNATQLTQQSAQPAPLQPHQQGSAAVNHATSSSKGKPQAPSSTAVTPGISADSTPIYRCDNCGTTETPLWRTKTLAGGKEKRVCNDCGLYFNDNKKMRPRHLWGLTGEAALGKGVPAPLVDPKGSANKKQKGRAATKNQPLNIATETSADLPRPPESPLRNKRPSDAFASPRRSSRLKTGQTPSRTPARPPSSEGYNGIEDSPSKHLRLTPRRQAQARNMEHELNSHAKHKLGETPGSAQERTGGGGQSKQSGNSLAVSPFASASTERSQSEAIQQQSTTVTTTQNDSTDWDEQIRKLLASHDGSMPPGQLSSANVGSGPGLELNDMDLDIQELLQAVAADPVEGFGGQAVMGGTSFSQAEIEMLVNSMSADGKSNGDMDWQAFSTSPWSVEHTPVAGAGPSRTTNGSTSVSTGP